MNDTQALEQKLEELIAQLNNLLAQLSGEDKNISPPTDIPKTDPQKTTENLEIELQRLKARRQSEPTTDQIKEGIKAKDKNGWNYVSSYLQNRF
jgi:hypothetical protein